MYKYIKRFLDFLAAAMILLVIWPVLLIIAILIKVLDGEEVLFKQKRPGKYGRIFTIYKFKTMKKNTTETKTDMQRITKIGGFLRKVSLDELPQLFNILRGEMSFIGPRPLLVRYLQYYSPEQMRRHNVLPGISGYAQVNGRNLATWEERFKMDIYYVEHMSFFLDVKIFMKTLTSVFSGSGVNKSDEETMTYFDDERRRLSK